MALFIISSLVSILTIFILFLRIKNIKPREIPSWFFGKSKTTEIRNKIKLNRPPILPVVLILLITLCFCLAYLQQKNASEKTNASRAALIWLDPSLSAKLSRISNKFNPEAAAETILDYGYKNFGLAADFKLLNGKVTLEFKVVQLDSKVEIIEYLTLQNNLTSPFSQSILADKVTKLLNSNEYFFDKKNIIIALSDGNSNSLQGLYALKNFFSQGILIKSKENFNTKKSQYEIIPTELFELWHEKSKNKEDFSVFKKFKSYIPQEARPHLIVNSYEDSEDFFKFLSIKDNKKTLPLFIACSDKYPSPLELDSYSSLRTLVNFFGSDFIEKQCERESPAEKEYNHKNIWKYRNAAVWIVQLNEQIISTMNDDLSFWLPEGFDPNFDTLVYTAGSSLNSEETLSQTYPIQLDAGAFPLQLSLIAHPPGAELGIRFPDDNRTYKGVFQPFYNAADGTILAWKASSLPFFYLRTTTATPNGELGRSRTWTHFWFEVANTLKQSNLSFTTIQLTDIGTMYDKFAEADLNTEDKLTAILDLNTLNFNSSDKFTLGLYKVEKKQKMVLITTKQDNKMNATLSVEEFNSYFSSEMLEKKEQLKENNIGTSLLHLFAAVFGTILLFLLWFEQKTTYLVFILICFSLYYKSNIFAAENFSLPFFPTINDAHRTSQVNVPFRIAWCGNKASNNLEKKYSELRSTIMRRGTIVFPEKIKINGCQPGEAEIWWANDFRDLKINDLNAHISNGGIFILEGSKEVPADLLQLTDQSIGMQWESPKKRGMFYRSFYLLQSLDGCLNDTSKVLILRKKISAQAPYGLVISTYFLSNGEDCFKENNDYRLRSFINIFYSFLTTDYKEDQIQMPEILNRIKNLGLEP